MATFKIAPILCSALYSLLSALIDDFRGQEYDKDLPNSKNLDLDLDDHGDDKYGYWISSQERKEDHQQYFNPNHDYLQHFYDDEEEAVLAIVEALSPLFNVLKASHVPLLIYMEDS